MQYVNSKIVGNTMGVLVNIAGSAPGSNSLTATLRRLAIQINTRFGLGYALPEDFKYVLFLHFFLLVWQLFSLHFYILISAIIMICMIINLEPC